MWIFVVRCGYFSAVQRDGHADQLVVRARDKEDLRRLRELYLPELGDTATYVYTEQMDPNTILAGCAIVSQPGSLPSPEQECANAGGMWSSSGSLCRYPGQ